MSDDVLKDRISNISLLDTMPQYHEYFYHEDDGLYKITAGDLRVLFAARMSTNNASGQSFEKDARLIKYLIQNKHFTPFEQVQLTFVVKAPIFVARQWFRHRAFSYNEASARYQDKTDEEEFYIPTEWRLQDNKNKQGSQGNLRDDKASDLSFDLATFCNEAAWRYEQAIKSGVSKEMARFFLPVNMYTKFIVSGNLRNWLWNFCIQRNHPHAQEEIRVYAEYIEKEISHYAPLTYKYYLENK